MHEIVGCAPLLVCPYLDQNKCTPPNVPTVSPVLYKIVEALTLQHAFGRHGSMTTFCEPAIVVRDEEQQLCLQHFLLPLEPAALS